MKVNRDAQDIYDVVIELNANNRQRDILEPGHDPHNAFKDFTYLEDDDFKTVRIFKVGFISVWNCEGKEILGNTFTASIGCIEIFSRPNKLKPFDRKITELFKN